MQGPNFAKMILLMCVQGDKNTSAGQQRNLGLTFGQLFPGTRMISSSTWPNYFQAMDCGYVEHK